MDSDNYQIPVGAAAEGGGVLQTVSKPELWISSASASCRGGNCHETMGVQWETGHVYVPGMSPLLCLNMLCYVVCLLDLQN